MKRTELVAGRRVVFEDDGDGLHVFWPELKGCHSFGKALVEARRNMAEAIALWLESADDLGMKVSL